MPDIHTLILSSTIISIFCTGPMALLWLQNRKRFAGIGFWLVDYFLTGVGIGLEALQGSIPNFFSIVVANALVFFGSILFYEGLQRFSGKRVAQAHNYILLAIFVLVQAWFTYFYPSFLVRDINNSVAIFVYVVQITWFVFRYAGGNRSFSMFSLGVIFIFCCLSSVIRIGMDLFVDSSAVFLESKSLPFVFIGYQMLQLSTTIILFLQINYRLVARLEDDIKQRKQIEQSLEESEKHYRSLFANMLDGFAYCQMLYKDGKADDFVYLEVNSAFEELTGLQNVIGLKVSETIPGIREANPELFEIYGRVISTGISEQFETYVPGLNAWFLVSVYSIQLEYFVVVFKNITERKRMEDALKASQKLAAELYESAPDALVTVNRQGRITHANSQTQVLLGYTVDELLNQPIEMLIHQNLTARHTQNRDDFFAHPRTREMGSGLELSIVRKDGVQVRVEIKLSALQTGDEIFVTANIRDIRERIQRETRLQQVQLQVIEQQRKLASFDERQRMARDLHDSVNQSIHSLVLFSETLTATLEKNNVTRAVQISQRIQESARQAIKETRLLLYQPDEISLKREANLVDELNIRLANIELRAGLKAQVILEGSLEHCPAAWYENLFLIAIEALNNSLKHAQAAGVTITIRSFPALLELEVLDDGKGFDTARTKAGGYGLQNMQKRATLLGGCLMVESPPIGVNHAGTRVLFHIDIKE